MRKWHRWLSVLFGVFLVWIAITGVLSQIVPWFVGRPDEQVAAVVPPGFVCPETMFCRPKMSRNVVVVLHDLHSGESFGPAGIFVLTLAGLAMVFFSLSGLWLYISMWRNRARRKLKPGWFWK